MKMFVASIFALSLLGSGLGAGAADAQSVGVRAVGTTVVQDCRYRHAGYRAHRSYRQHRECRGWGWRHHQRFCSRW